MSLCVGVGICAFQETGFCTTNKPSSDADALAAAQNFEKAFQQVVEQVKPAVVSITSVKVFKHSQQKQKQKRMPKRPVPSSATATTETRT